MLSSLISNFALASSNYSTTSYRSTATPEEAAAAIAMIVFGFALLCAITAIVLAIEFAVAYFVYQDAKKSNVESPILWAVITLFSLWLGLLLYYLVAKRQVQTTAPAEAKRQPEHTPTM